MAGPIGEYRAGSPVGDYGPVLLVRERAGPRIATKERACITKKVPYTIIAVNRSYEMHTEGHSL
jgi:hypothetical protein